MLISNRSTLHFNPRSPRGGATRDGHGLDLALQISIHAPHEGERHPSALTSRNCRYFNPRSPRGGATRQSWGAHGCDAISIHAPHEGERRRSIAATFTGRLFQSTLPTRGSDPDPGAAGVRHGDFNPRSPRGGATRYHVRQRQRRGISIHAPHEGERRERKDQELTIITFQSTLPTRGSDRTSDSSFCSSRNFNPRSPRGGATRAGGGVGGQVCISIHAPHEGERLVASAQIFGGFQFQSTLPTRGSDQESGDPAAAGHISIHAPHEGERPERRTSTA